MVMYVKHKWWELQYMLYHRLGWAEEWCWGRWDHSVSLKHFNTATFWYDVKKCCAFLSYHLPILEDDAGVDYLCEKSIKESLHEESL